VGDLLSFVLQRLEEGLRCRIQDQKPVFNALLRNHAHLHRPAISLEYHHTPLAATGPTVWFLGTPSAYRRDSGLLLAGHFVLRVNGMSIITDHGKGPARMLGTYPGLFGGKIITRARISPYGSKPHLCWFLEEMENGNSSQTMPEELGDRPTSRKQRRKQKRKHICVIPAQRLWPSEVVWQSSILASINSSANFLLSSISCCRLYLVVIYILLSSISCCHLYLVVVCILLSSISCCHLHLVVICNLKCYALLLA
jgi:hypothetical protein